MIKINLCEKCITKKYNYNVAFSNYRVTKINNNYYLFIVFKRTDKIFEPFFCRVYFNENELIKILLKIKNDLNFNIIDIDNKFNNDISKIIEINKSCCFYDYYFMIKKEDQLN